MGFLRAGMVRRQVRQQGRDGVQEAGARRRGGLLGRAGRAVEEVEAEGDDDLTW